MTLKETTSDREMTRITFVDSYKEPCSLHQSSSAKEERIWLGLRKNAQYMLLNRETVKDLLPYLQRFVETGKLTE